MHKLKQTLKKNLNVPEYFFETIWTIRKNVYTFLSNEKKIIQRYEDDFIEKNGLTVQSGPFKDLKYVAEVDNSKLAKLVGYYEDALHEQVEQIKQEDYDTIINIGTAEGGYLIGLAKFFPKATLIGYDIDPIALDLVKKMAVANGVQNQIHLFAECTIDSLDKFISNKTLLLCDAEGFERSILNPSECEKLAIVSKFVIETHDHKPGCSGTTQTLIDRFAPTHKVSSIQLKAPDQKKYSFLQKIKNDKHRSILTKERTTTAQEVLVFERLSK